MHVGIDVTCMHTNFGGCGLFVCCECYIYLFIMFNYSNYIYYSSVELIPWDVTGWAVLI